MKRVITWLFMCVSTSFFVITPVKAMTGMELAAIGGVAGLGAYAKDFLEGVRNQLKTEKGRRAVIRWLYSCGVSCWQVCHEKALADQFIPTQDLEYDLRSELVKLFGFLQENNVAQVIDEKNQYAEFIFKKEEGEGSSEYTSLVPGGQDVLDPIFYVGFFVKPHREIPERRLAKWTDNQGQFIAEVGGLFKDLGSKAREDRIEDWVRDGNVADLAKTATQAEIKDPVMAYAFGGFSRKDSSKGSSMEAPVVMVVLRGKLPTITSQPRDEGGNSYEHLLRKKQGEADATWYEYLGKQSTGLRMFKENIQKALVFPPKREAEAADEMDSL